MEGANEAARRAVNCIIDASGVNVAFCKVWGLHEPLFFKPIKWYDSKRYAKGLPYSLHTPWWLKVFMIPWAAVSLVVGLAQWIWAKITG